VHLIGNTLHGPVANANLAGDLGDPHAGPQTILDAFFDGCAGGGVMKRVRQIGVV